jgi:hypothetical protein
MAAFTFHSDPGHAWLSVLPEHLASVELKPESFSRYSYKSRGGEVFYLEEDCDAPKFMAAYKAKFGADSMTIKEMHTDGDIAIRRMQSIHNL